MNTTPSSPERGGKAPAKAPNLSCGAASSKLRGLREELIGEAICGLPQVKLRGGYGLRFYFAGPGRGKPMKARVFVTLRSGILDPQGKAIEGALRSLQIEGIAGVRQGKLFDVELEGEDRAAAKARLREACEKLLANQVVEDFEIEIV